LRADDLRAAPAAGFRFERALVFEVERVDAERVRSAEVFRVESVFFAISCVPVL
jgi:hypothetical protein